MDAGVVDVGVVVVYHRGSSGSLPRSKTFELEVQSAPAEGAFRVVGVTIERARVDNRGLGAGSTQLFADVEPVGIEATSAALSAVEEPGGSR